MRHAFPLPALALTATLLCWGAGAGAAAPSQARLEELSNTVQALLDAHDRIAAGHTPPATYGEARNLLAAGRERIAKGELAQARDLLARAYDDATQVVIADRAGQTLTNARADQYRVRPGGDREAALVQARIEAVRALVDAYGRVAPEKGGIDKGAMAEVDRRLEAAQSMAMTGRTGEARVQAEAAYAHISALVIGVRQGDRLVKTLAFETPAEEFAYEVDRHSSYRMLLRLTAAEQGKEETPEFRRAETEAERGRSLAEVEAQAGRWPEAIRLLERSTAGLVGAIRASGRFIPG